ncbi:hypothetical protein C2G38_13360 [Gigaspora rosea]|uniref:SWIM-type domain-containing protein n=1 Tax=Gigaspora rosea TaxID=44941 RepID=A0A397UTA8_9GLOM|nr:hypothetical protein C2G38_13360 [Gigaspora rosea]
MNNDYFILRIGAPVIYNLQTICMPQLESVDMDSIRKTSIKNGFLVLSTKQNDLFYTVNSKIRTCTCQVGATGASCKHQGQITKNCSFYANFTSQELESSNQRIEIISTTDNSDNFTLDIFVEEVRNDYQNAGSQFCVALNKFIEQYRASKSISITRLNSFLHNINSNVDATRIKSGAIIRVQVESVKRRKLEGSSRVRKSGANVNRMKENVDSQTILSRKKRKVNKKRT